jgi:hypothetical protein
MNQRFLILYPRDPEGMLARQPPLVRRLQAFNQKLVGSPIVIAGSFLGCSLEDLSAKISERLSA